MKKPCKVCWKKERAGNNGQPNAGSNSKTRLAEVAGVLALALLASGLIGSQMPSMAAVQTGSSSGGRRPGKTVTSIDDIDCSKVKSAVHCVDDYMVAGAEKESSTNAGTHNNSAASSTVPTSGAAVAKVRPLRTKSGSDAMLFHLQARFDIMMASLAVPFSSRRQKIFNEAESLL